MKNVFVFVVMMALSACSPAWDYPLPSPWQSDLEQDDPLRSPDDLGISRVAMMEAKVFVLSRKDYKSRSSDPLSEFSSIDLAVSWDKAALKSIREMFSVRQNSRRYHWSYIGPESRTEPDEVKLFRDASANWHLVAGSRAVEIDLDDIEKRRCGLFTWISR